MVGASARVRLPELRKAMRKGSPIWIAGEKLTVSYIKIEDLENWNDYHTIEAEIGAFRDGQSDEIKLTGIVTTTKPRLVLIDQGWKKKLELARTSKRSLEGS